MHKPAAFALAALLLAALPLSAQTKPDFSGTWTLDAARTAQLNGGRAGAAMGQAGSISSVGAAPAGSNTMSPSGAATAPSEFKITQTAAALTIERTTPAGPQKFVHKLDGSESVNINGRTTMTTKTRWQGATLVTEGTNVFAGQDGAMTIDLKEIRSIESDGTLLIVTTRTVEGNTSTSKQVLARKKM